MANQGIVYAGWDPDWFNFFLGAVLLFASSPTMPSVTTQRRGDRMTATVEREHEPRPGRQLPMWATLAPHGRHVRDVRLFSHSITLRCVVTEALLAMTANRSTAPRKNLNQSGSPTGNRRCPGCHAEDERTEAAPIAVP